MTYEKHTTHTDALDTLGTIIGPDEKRDAIHLAVEPVVAGQPLGPGMNVRLHEGLAMFAASPDEGVGIVDPFLTESVKAGQCFWLVVYPRQISSLRHVWEHPDFPPSTDLGIDISRPLTPVTDAEEYIRAFVHSSDLQPYGFDVFIEACKTGYARTDDDDYLRIEDGYVLTGGFDSSGSIPDKLWEQVEIFIGGPTARGDHFSCSC